MFVEVIMRSYLDFPDQEAHEGLRIRWPQVPSKLDYRIQLAVSWLLEIQDPVGFWDSRGPWLSGAVIKTLILARPKVPQLEQQISNAVIRGIEWLAGDKTIVRQPHGGLAWDTNLGVWDTAVILRGLTAAGYSDHLVINGVKGWLRDQVGRRYFGSTTVPYGESYPAQTFLALEELGERIYSRDIGKRFQKNQLSDGSWGDHFNTAEVLQYLVRHSDDNSEAIAKALSYIERTQSSNGTWSSLTWPTALTLMAYLEASSNPYSIITVRALEYLSGQQHTNGSWFHLLADTAFATQALVVALDRLDFARFDLVTDSDFKISSITLLPEIVTGESHSKRDVIQIDRRVFNLFRILLGIVAIYFIWTFLNYLGQGWAILNWQQRFDFVFKLLGAVITVLISIFASPLAKKLSKYIQRQ